MQAVIHRNGIALATAIATTFNVTVHAHRPDSIPNASPETAVGDSVYEIQEIVVEGANIVRKKDGFVLFPSKETKERSNDAIELIGNMNLPGVFLDNRTQSLSSVREGSLGYLITTLRHRPLISGPSILRISRKSNTLRLRVCGMGMWWPYWTFTPSVPT